MPMRRYILAVSLIVIVLSGCAAGKFQVNKYTPGTPSNGIVYALPKTVVSVSIPYKVKASVRLMNGRYIKRATASLGEVAVSTYMTPDPDNYFEIDSSLTNSATWKNAFSASISENMVLTSANLVTEDQTLAAVKDAVSLLGGVKNLLDRSDGDDPVKAQAEVDELIKTQEKLRTELHKLINEKAEGDISSDEQKRIDARIAFYEKTINYTKARISELVIRKPRELDVTILCEVGFSEPSEPFVIDTTSCHMLNQVYSKLIDLGVTQATLVPSFTFTLDSTARPSAPQSVAAGENAYIYRIPYIGSYTVSANITGDPIVSSGPIKVAQLGAFGRVYVEKTRFAKHTTEVQLHEATGGMKMYKSVREGSAASNAAQGLQGIAEEIAEIRKKPAEPTELEKLQAENLTLQEQIKNIEFQRRLAELIDE